MSEAYAAAMVDYLQYPFVNWLNEDDIPQKQYSRFRADYFDTKHKIKVGDSERSLNVYQIQLELRKAFQAIVIDDLLGCNEVIIGEYKKDYKQVSFWFKQFEKRLKALQKQYKQCAPIEEMIDNKLKLQFTFDRVQPIISAHIREAETKYGNCIQ